MPIRPEIKMHPMKMPVMDDSKGIACIPSHILSHILSHMITTRRVAQTSCTPHGSIHVGWISSMYIFLDRNGINSIDMATVSIDDDLCRNRMHTWKKQSTIMRNGRKNFMVRKGLSARNPFIARTLVPFFPQSM
jgi:hypothetical protein